MPGINSVGIISKPGIPHASGIIPKLIAWLDGHNIKPRYDAETAVYLGRSDGLDRTAVPEGTQLVIVLGGDEDINAYRRWGGVQVNEAGERLIAGVELARRFPLARLIYTGGTASMRADRAPGDPSQMMYDAWVALGVDPARIVLERASRNTSENARMTLALAQPQGGQVHLLVTSAFHMPRSIETFARAGWTGLVAWPVDFRSGSLASAPTWTLDKNLSDLDTALKEYLGLLAYRIAGQ